MTRGPHAELAFAIGVAVVLSTAAAQARCTIDATGLDISPLMATTGTYTPPTAPIAQPVSFTVTGTYSTNPAAGTCRVAISFNRATLPAEMARAGGGTAMPYAIQSAPSGGNSLVFAGGGTPGAANRLEYSFAAAGGNLTSQPFSATLTAYLLALPVTTQPAGSYSDGLTLGVYDINNGGAASLLITRGFTATGNVAKACTIGGVTNPSADTATIGIGANGSVSTAAISKSYSNVVCNTPSSLQLTSQSGAVKNASSAPSGFSNLIDYTSTATFAGATATLDTIANPGAAGAEVGPAASTSGQAPTGDLLVEITPRANLQPLISGTYTDTLRITITPQ